MKNKLSETSKKYHEMRAKVPSKSQGSSAAFAKILPACDNQAGGERNLSKNKKRDSPAAPSTRNRKLSPEHNEGLSSIQRIKKDEAKVKEIRYKITINNLEEQNKKRLRKFRYLRE